MKAMMTIISHRWCSRLRCLNPNLVHDAAQSQCLALVSNNNDSVTGSALAPVSIFAPLLNMVTQPS